MPIVAREVTQFALSDGGEVALCGWWWIDNTGTELEDTVAQLSAVFAASYWWENTGATDGRASYSGHTSMAQRWLEQIDQDTGHVTRRIFLDLPTDLPGQSAAGQLPAEVAICVGVRSGFSERSGNGRFYLPPPSVDNLTGTGTFTGALQDLQVNALGNYFEAVYENDGTMALGTWSQQAGAFTPAQSINVGNIPDAQRRRRNKLVESRRNLGVNGH
jgi:hypothetical protein